MFVVLLFAIAPLTAMIQLEPLECSKMSEFHERTKTFVLHSLGLPRDFFHDNSYHPFGAGKGYLLRRTRRVWAVSTLRYSVADKTAWEQFEFHRKLVNALRGEAFFPREIYCMINAQWGYLVFKQHNALQIFDSKLGHLTADGLRDSFMDMLRIFQFFDDRGAAVAARGPLLSFIDAGGKIQIRPIDFGVVHRKDEVCRVRVMPANLACNAATGVVVASSRLNLLSLVSMLQYYARRRLMSFMLREDRLRVESFAEKTDELIVLVEAEPNDFLTFENVTVFVCSLGENGKLTEIVKRRREILLLERDSSHSMRSSPKSPSANIEFPSILKNILQG